MDELRELRELRSQNKWLKQQIENIARQHGPLEPIPDTDGWSQKLPGYDLSSLIKDAKRYRYMRDFPYANVARSVGITDGTRYWLQFEAADAAVDAAMAQDEIVQDEVVDFDIDRVKRSIAGARITMPENLDRRQLREWLKEQSRIIIEASKLC
jgi:predicted metal-dependent hydrolase